MSGFAARLGKTQGYLTQMVQAATVYKLISQLISFDHRGRTQQLFEIHAAPDWLWCALVEAMVAALAYPETQQGKKRTSLLNNEVSGGYVRQARFVLRHCRDKAEEVLKNAQYPLTVAYDEAQEIVERQRLAFMYPEVTHGGDRKSNDFKVQNCTLILNKRERIDLNMCRFTHKHNEPLGRLVLAVHRSNTQNRDATPGQKAMATAMAFPEPKRGMHSQLLQATGKNGFDKSTLSRARYVRRSYPIPEGEDHPQERSRGGFKEIAPQSGQRTDLEPQDGTGQRLTRTEAAASRVLAGHRKAHRRKHGGLWVFLFATRWRRAKKAPDRGGGTKVV